jgi:hypothetical protein
MATTVADLPKRLRITAAGNVGIGTASPTKSLEVAAGGTVSNGILVTGSSSPQIRIEEASGVTGSFGLDSAGSYFGTKLTIRKSSELIVPNEPASTPAAGS